MEALSTEKISRRVRQIRTTEGEDREMEECLARLRVWQTENLMAPHGMDRFLENPGRRKR